MASAPGLDSRKMRLGRSECDKLQGARLCGGVFMAKSWRCVILGSRPRMTVFGLANTSPQPRAIKARAEVWTIRGFRSGKGRQGHALAIALSLCHQARFASARAR